MRRGAVAVVMVLLISVAGLFVLVGWQSRLLLAIQRSQSGSDSVRATYGAESKIYDWVARFFGDYPNLFTSPLTTTSQIIEESTLVDGTQLTVSGQIIDDEEVLEVTANRQFARTSIEVARRSEGSTGPIYDEVEIAISLDCSGSMNLRANPACVGPGCTSRMTEAKSAILSFIDRVQTEQDAGGTGTLLVGLNVFKRQSAWASYNSVPLTPTSDMTHLRQAVEFILRSSASLSPACQSSSLNASPNQGGETNLGDGAVDLARYLNSNASTNKKQIMILITDGLPNWSLDDVACGTIRVGCNEGATCTDEAIRYLTCGVADTNTDWEPGRPGLRHPDTDVYAVTVANPGTLAEITAFNKTIAVFSNTNYVKDYYANQNATELSEILDDIFGQIIEASQMVRIRRLVPGP